MDKFFSNTIFLAQTDTTAGFLSKSREHIISIKQSNKNKKILMEVDSIRELKQHTRIPKAAKESFSDEVNFD